MCRTTKIPIGIAGNRVAACKTFQFTCQLTSSAPGWSANISLLQPNYCVLRSHVHLPQTDVAWGKVIIPNYCPYSVHRYSMNTNRKFYLKIVYLSGKYLRIQVTTCYYVRL